VTAGDGAHGFGPIAGYLPHQPPMRLLDDIIEITEARAVCRATIRPDCVFAIDGRVHPAAMIEYVAQACAVYAGAVSAQSGGGPRLGMIMACREVDFAVDAFAVGDELTIAAQKVFAGSQMAAFTGTVLRGGQVCATLQLSVVDAEYAAAQPPPSAHAPDAGDDG
jgi:predicted hotdog family 3-hydroxylacyl-ACP dehydratase